MKPTTMPRLGGRLAANCWYGYDISKTAQTIDASAFKDCVHLDESQGVSLTLETYVRRSKEGVRLLSPKSRC